MNGEFGFQEQGISAFTRNKPQPLICLLEFISSRFYDNVAAIGGEKMNGFLENDDVIGRCPFIRVDWRGNYQQTPCYAENWANRLKSHASSFFSLTQSRDCGKFDLAETNQFLYIKLISFCR